MKILVTGASGLVGKELVKSLKVKGHEVSILSRTNQDLLGCQSFVWDYKKNYIDLAALEGLDAIVHLAGATVSKFWSSSYKKEIEDSRIKTAELLFNSCQKLQKFPKVFVTASGSSYYGQVTQKKAFVESDPSGNDFLAQVSKKWEAAADLFQEKSRVVKIRTSVVLSKKGGVLEKMLPVARFGFLSPLGSGKQYFSWVHIKDLVEIYTQALENPNAKGAYNAASPFPTTNLEFTKALLNQFGKKIFFPFVPTFLIRFLMGEMSVLLLEGSPLDGEKTQKQLHKYQFLQLEDALSDLFPKS